jgi:Domain of unknown function (DUF1905)
MLNIVHIDFGAELWEWDFQQANSWVFVSVPADLSADIRDMAGAVPRRGFGSIRVRATVGGSTWNTSIFPAAEPRGYVLPVKKAVRRSEGLDVGDAAAVSLEILDF